MTYETYTYDTRDMDNNYHNHCFKAMGGVHSDDEEQHGFRIANVWDTDDIDVVVCKACKEVIVDLTEAHS